LLILLFLAGLSLVLYPIVSNFWNQKHSSYAVASYQENVSALEESDYSRIWQAAADFNTRLRQRTNPYDLPDDMMAEYPMQLNLSGDGIMGYVEIPLISVMLPICHGTSDSVLQTGLGHLEWTSLPVGGEGSHCVLSGHRGLPSAKLLTNLDSLAEGDVFMLHVLGETLTYEIDQILIVLPTDIQSLGITEGEDYCTLVTCTPYGVNTHRLLVRGHRVDTVAERERLRLGSDARQIETLIVMPIVATPLLFLAILFMFVSDKREKRARRKYDEDDS